MYIDPIKPIKMDIFPIEKQEQNKGQETFDNFLKKTIYDVSNSKKYADDLNRELMAGTLENMHDLTIAQAVANFKFQALVEVDNKLIEAYKEIARMQI